MTEAPRTVISALSKIISMLTAMPWASGKRKLFAAPFGSFAVYGHVFSVAAVICKGDFFRISVWKLMLKRFTFITIICSEDIFEPYATFPALAGYSAFSNSVTCWGIATKVVGGQPANHLLGAFEANFWIWKSRKTCQLCPCTKLGHSHYFFKRVSLFWPFEKLRGLLFRAFWEVDNN